MKTLLFIATLLLLGCEGYVNNYADVPEDIYRTPMITYFQDCRSGVCFAQIKFTASGLYYTDVPCDSVRAFLKPCWTLNKAPESTIF